MQPPTNFLQSSDIVSYSYISLFMLTYRKSSTTHLNGDIREHLSSLDSFLGRSTINKSTVVKLRHDLVKAFNQRFFPDSTLTLKDPLTLLSLFSYFPALFGLSFPAQFLEDLSLAQDAIAVSLDTTDSSIKSFFSSLLTHQHPFLTSDISFILIALLEFIESHQLPTWHDVLSTIRQSLLHDVLTSVYSFPIDFTLSSPPDAISLIESHLQDLFKTPTGHIRRPSDSFKYLIIDTIDLLIQDEYFRKSTQKRVLENKALHAPSNSTTRLSV